MNVNDLLSVIYAHYKENEPQDVEYVFSTSASPEEIAATEAAIGIPFPDALRNLYSRYRSLSCVWDSISVFSPAEIPSSHHQLLEMAANDPPIMRALGPVAPLIHTPTRIPFAVDNDRDILIDLDPPVGGKVGQIVRLDMECGEIEVIAESLPAFLEQGLKRLKGDAAK